MERIAVVAHREKRLGAGLPELRRQLVSNGFDDPIWFEVSKSKRAPKRVRQAIEDGAEVILVWGGDGMVQRSIDATVGQSSVTLADPSGWDREPPGHQPRVSRRRLDPALDVALHGRDRPLDVGTVNGEHFAVMSGLGFDAEMIDAAERVDQAEARAPRAYVRTGVGAMRSDPVDVRIKVDGTPVVQGCSHLHPRRQRRHGHRWARPSSTTQRPMTESSMSVW